MSGAAPGTWSGTETPGDRSPDKRTAHDLNDLLTVVEKTVKGNEDNNALRVGHMKLIIHYVLAT